MNDTLQNLMREATRLTQSGNLKEATQVIQQALGNAGRAPTPPPSTFTTAPPIILDGYVFEVEQQEVPGPETSSPWTSRPDSSLQGEFVDGSHTHASLTRSYKLYTPPGSVDKSLPLVVRWRRSWRQRILKSLRRLACTRGWRWVQRVTWRKRWQR